MKFEVGSSYSFTISGLICIPDKGDHYVLLHESGRKMLLKADYYSKYNFSIGQVVECKIDKVNCSGQIFLEPKHPIYSEGISYLFPLIKVYDDRNLLFNATVKDLFDNEIDVFIHHLEKFHLKGNLLFKVISIKKGIPILSQDLDEEIKENKYEIGKYIKLKITSLKRLNSEDYFILSDGIKEIAKLKVKHYYKYGFKVGDDINCKILGFEVNDSLMVDPVNPFYEVGKSYIFEIESISEFLDLEGNKATNVIVLDTVKNKCGVKINNAIAPEILKKSGIKCIVTGFRKGRPQLEIDPLNF